MLTFTAIAFTASLACIFWWVSKKLWIYVGGNLELPKGRKWGATIQTNGARYMRAIVVADETVGLFPYNGPMVAQHCCKINNVVHDVLYERNLLRPLMERQRNIVVNIIDDRLFDILFKVRLKRARGQDYVDATDAFISKCHTRFYGKAWTMITIRSSKCKYLMLHGEPLVHGLLHAYQGNFDVLASHGNPLIWKEASPHAAQVEIQKRITTL